MTQSRGTLKLPEFLMQRSPIRYGLRAWYAYLFAKGTLEQARTCGGERGFPLGHPNATAEDVLKDSTEPRFWFDPDLP